jgi:hypothetical protein
MAKRDGDVDNFRDLVARLAVVVDSLDSAVAIVSTPEVWELLDGVDRESSRLFAKVVTPGRTSARARLLAFLISKPRVWIRASTLRRVAGITAWQRRLRELRDDEGWPIESGGTSYRLQSSVRDTSRSLRRSKLT